MIKRHPEVGIKSKLEVVFYYFMKLVTILAI